MKETVTRCDWARSKLEQEYHDHEWGRPLHDEKRLFQMLMLEGQQAGLSWSTILNKREALLKAYDGFDPEKLAVYDETKIEELMQNAGIIRNRRKIEAAIHNAKAYFDLVKQHGSLDGFLWRYVDNKPIVNAWEKQEQVPATTVLSDQISKDLKKMGFKFVGSTIIYAYMQSIGMVNDHLVSCICYEKGTFPE